MTMTNTGHILRSAGEKMFRICRAMVATNVIRQVQIEASPIITCPATKYFGCAPLLANSTNAHIQAVNERMAATAISISPCVRVKAFGGYVVVAFSGIFGNHGETGGRSGGRCDTSRNKPYAADHMSRNERG